jgi:hypothetical protein
LAIKRFTKINKKEKEGIKRLNSIKRTTTKIKYH